MDYTDLILSYLSGEANEGEIILLREWLAKSNENKRIFDEMSDIWASTGTIKPGTFDAKRAFDTVKHKIQNIKPFKQTDIDNIRWYRVAVRIAAVLVIGLVFSMFFMYKSLNKGVANIKTEGSPTEITAPLGSKTLITLPDGTKVWLNGGSSLSYNHGFNSTERKIELSGEAYFDVAKNTRLPFLVSTPEITIKVLGTAFNIKAYPGEGSIETTLERGSLIVEQNTGSAENTQTILAPRQRATFVKNSGKILLSDTETQIMKKENVHNVEMAKGKVLVSTEVDTEIFTAWKDNRLVFRNETFESLAVKLERWYGVKIIFSGAGLKNLHFNGTIENETINDVLEIIRLTLPIDYSILHNNVTITNKK